MGWTELTNDPQYQAMDAVQRNEVRQKFFTEVIQKEIPQDIDPKVVYSKFVTMTEEVDPSLKVVEQDRVTTLIKTLPHVASEEREAYLGRSLAKLTPEERDVVARQLGPEAFGKGLAQMEQEGLEETITDPATMLEMIAGGAFGVAGKGARVARGLASGLTGGVTELPFAAHGLYGLGKAGVGALKGTLAKGMSPIAKADKTAVKEAKDILLKEPEPIVLSTETALIRQGVGNVPSTKLTKIVDTEKVAEKVTKVFTQNKAEAEALKKIKWREMPEKFVRYVVDASGNAKKSLEQFGKKGKEAIMAKDFIHGANADAKMQINELFDTTFKGLKKEGEDTFNQFLRAKRTVEIDTNLAVKKATATQTIKEIEKDFQQLEPILKEYNQNLLAILRAGRPTPQLKLLAQQQLGLVNDLKSTKLKMLAKRKEMKEILDRKMVHPGGLKGEDHQIWLDELIKKNPELYQELEKRQAVYRQTLDNQLQKSYEGGLISAKTLERLRATGENYNPRVVLEYIDPEGGVIVKGGRKISVGESGIKALDEGTVKAMETDSRLMASEYIGRNINRIARNKANQKLADVATELEDNGVVRHLKKGDKVAGNEALIEYMVDGEKRMLVTSKKFAEEWVRSDPMIDSRLVDFISFPNKILKAMATGLNPEFALTNIPRDIAHIWTSTSEYSKHLPAFLPQIAKDLGETFKDAFFKRGKYIDYIKQGGGMDFMTTQGRISNKYLGKVQDVLGAVGEFSERWTRLALRNRAIKNGIPGEEATWIARNYLDHSLGGSMAKAVDKGVPYLNAAIQGTRGFVRAAMKDPEVFAYKLGQIGALSSGLYYANTTVNKEAWDQIPEAEKSNNFIITTPLSYRDKNGDKKYLYFKIAKDQSQRVFSSIFEGIAGLSMGHKINSKQIAKSAADFLPFQNMIPPVGSALLAYAGNLDTWLWSRVWTGQGTTAAGEIKPELEKTPYTNPAFIKLGETFGVSPVRTERGLQKIFTYGNIYTDLVGSGLRMMMDSLPEERQEQAMTDIVSKWPFIRKVTASTKPFTKYEADIRESKIEENSRRLEQKQNVLRLAEVDRRQGLFEGESEATDNYINAQPVEDQKRLRDEYKFMRNVTSLNDSTWWKELKTMGAEKRAESFYKRWKGSSDTDKDKLMENMNVLKGFASKPFMNKLYQLME